MCYINIIAKKYIIILKKNYKKKILFKDIIKIT